MFSNDGPIVDYCTVCPDSGKNEEESSKETVEETLFASAKIEDKSKLQGKLSLFSIVCKQNV